MSDRLALHRPVETLGHAHDREGVPVEGPLVPDDLVEAEPTEGGLRPSTRTAPSSPKGMVVRTHPELSEQGEPLGQGSQLEPFLIAERQSAGSDEAIADVVPRSRSRSSQQPVKRTTSFGQRFRCGTSRQDAVKVQVVDGCLHAQGA